MGNGWTLALLLHIPFICGAAVETNWTVTAKRGKFFVQRLESPWNQSENNAIRYSAAIQALPDLPRWLSLTQSEDGHLAFLHGTPELGDLGVDIKIVALDLVNYRTSQQNLRLKVKFDSKRQPKVNPFTNPSWSNFVTNCFNSYLLLCLTKLLHEGLRNIFVYVELLLVHVNELLSLKKARLVFLQDRYTVPTGQVILLRLTNIDVLEMLSSPELLQRLAASISRAFRGPQVRPYIRAIFTSVSAKSDFTNRFFKTKTKGLTVAVGSKSGFSNSVRLLAQGLKAHPEQCKRNTIVPLDSFFSPEFLIDWCLFRMMPLVLNNVESDSLAISKEGNLVSSKTNISISTHLFSIENNVLEGFVPFDWLIGGMKRNYFWDWVMIVAVPLAVLLLLLLGFTAFLFGCREGQSWRDFKTPRDKLDEYVAVRRSQAALRQMSMKRQSTADMICSAEISAHSVVNGIASRLEPGGVAVVGKQTVAEAAAHLGSHLQLYTGETESDEDTISAAERDSQLDETVALLRYNQPDRSDLTISDRKISNDSDTTPKALRRSAKKAVRDSSV